METNHDYRISKITRISNHSSPEELRDIMEELIDSDPDIPFEITDEDFDYIEEWIEELNEKGYNGFLFRAETPIIENGRYSWCVYTEKYIYAETFEEAEIKAQAFANTLLDK